MEPVRGVRVRVMVYGKDECGMFDGVRRPWLAVDKREADVPARGLLAMAFGGGSSCGWGGAEGVMFGARVVKRKPVESPMTCEKGL